MSFNLSARERRVLGLGSKATAQQTRVAMHAYGAVNGGKYPGISHDTLAAYEESMGRRTPEEAGLEVIAVFGTLLGGGGS